MHTDEAAFLPAITAGDETARLVFADWLDERSDPRGPWVRDPDIWHFMAPDATDPIPRLLERVGGEVPKKNWDLLARIGTWAVPGLVVATEDADDTVRCHAIDALGQIGPAAAAAVPDLVAIIWNCGWEVGECVVGALGRIGPTAAGVVSALCSALDHKDSGVVRCAADTLGEFGPAAAEAVDALISVLTVDREESELIALSVTDALGKIGPAAAKAVEKAVWALVNGPLQHENSRVQCSAVEALGRIGPGAACAVSALLKAAQDGSSDTWQAAISALLRIGQSPVAIPKLIDAVYDGHGDEETDEILAALGTIGPTAWPLLVSIALFLWARPYRGGVAAQSVAAEEFARLGPTTVPALVSVLCAADTAPPRWKSSGKRRSLPGRSLARITREYALSLFADIRVAEAVPALSPALAALLRDRDEHVRECAARALVEVAPAELIAALRDGSFCEHIDVVTKIGPQVDAAAPALVAALATAVSDEYDESKRGNLIEVLMSIAPREQVTVRALFTEAVRQGCWGRLSEAMAKTGTASVPLLFDKLLWYGELAERRLAAEGLGLIGPAAAEAVQVLEECAQGDPDENVRAAARDALDRIHPQSIE